MKTQIYPKNKSHFKKLIPFTKKIILICKENNIEPIIYGSFSHFIHTQDKNIEVNDIDLIISKEGLRKLAKLLKKNKINFIRCSPKDYSLVVKSGKLKVELDEVGTGYKTLNEKSLSKNIFDKVDFYGIPLRMITLKQLEEIYSVAYNRSYEDKPKLIEKINHLEKFLKRKLKSDVHVELVKNKNLSRKQKDAINHARVSHWGEAQRKDFDKDYEPETLWIFVKKKEKVVSLSGLRPIKVKYLGKTYNIGGICSTISLEKKKGYGKIMISFMIDYSRRTGQSILGFTDPKNKKIFEKSHLETKKDFIRRFVWLKPNGEKVYDPDGMGIYYEGKDKFISKVQETKSPVYIFVEHW